MRSSPRGKGFVVTSFGHRYISMLLVLMAMALIFSRASEARAQFAEGPEPGRYVVHIFNVNPGPELFTRFGHIAVLVEDRQLNQRSVYNYGTFDFENPNLKWKYVQGFLTFWLEVVPYRMVLPFYIDQDRTITLRTLALTPAQAERMVRRMDVNALPENREYDYRHYLDNCSTRIRDILDEVLDGALKKQFDKQPTGRTYRYWTREALRGMPVVSSIILFSLGPVIDHPITRWDEEFLPEVLAADLDNLRIGPEKKPIVARKTVLFVSKGPPAGAETGWPDIVTMIALFALLIFGFGLPILRLRGKRHPRLLGMGLLVYGLLSGLAGLMLVLYWTLTAHTDTYSNENLLVMPPLNLWMVGPALVLLIKGRIGPRTAKLLKGTMLLGLALIAFDLMMKIGPFIQVNYGVIAFSAGCYLAGYFAVRRTLEEGGEGTEA